MKRKNKRGNYQNYKYSLGSFLDNANSFAGSPKVQTIAAVGKALGEGLGEIGEMRKRSWEETQQQQRAINKANQEAYDNRLDVLNSLQQASNDRMAQWQGLYDQIDKQKANSLDTNHKYNIGGLISAGLAVDKGLGSVIGGEYSSGVGDTISKIPGLGIVGGLFNAMFGLKTNKAELERVANDRANLLNAASAASAATSFDDAALKSPQAVNMDVKAYEDGWFTNSAEGKNRALEEQLREASSYAKRSISNTIENIADTQQDMLESSYFKDGGSLFSNGINVIGNGDTHEQNPYEGVQMGMAPDGLPNLVEEGEVIYNDYVYSNRLKPTKDIKDKYNLKKDITFAEAAKKLQKESEERPNDPISKKGLEVFMSDLASNQEEVRQAKEARKARKTINSMSDEEVLALQALQQAQDTQPIQQEGIYKCGGKLGHKYDDAGKLFTDAPLLYNDVATVDMTPEEKIPVLEQIRRDKTTTTTVPEDIITDDEVYVGSAEESSESKGSPTWLRYAPAVASGLGFVGSLFDTPNYDYADSVQNAYNITPAMTSFKPIGTYLKYTPFDRNYYLNQLRSAGAASRRALLNTSGGNRGTAMAGILASDYNLLGNMGKLAREAEEYNLAQRQKVAEFNRGTDMFNSEGLFKASTANAQAMMDAAKLRAEGIRMASLMKQEEDNRYRSSLYGNLSGLAENLGNIGFENLNYNMADSNEALNYKANRNGTSEYKGGFDKNKKKKGGKK